MQKKKKKVVNDMSEVDNFIQENAEVHDFAEKIVRIISGIPQMPEFSNERLTVKSVSKILGIPESSVRAGIIYGWLPIGTAYRGNKIITSQSKSNVRTEYIISPRKLWEEFGYVWEGKAALEQKTDGI